MGSTVSGQLVSRIGHPRDLVVGGGVLVLADVAASRFSAQVVPVAALALAARVPELPLRKTHDRVVVAE